MNLKRAFVLIALLSFAFSFPALSHAQADAPKPVILLTTLSLGSTGPDVYALQEFLRAQGYFTYPTSTSFFGPATKAALIAFQHDNGIDPIGIAGPVTRLRIALISGMASAVPDPAPATSTVKKVIYHSGGSRATYTIGGTVSGLSGTAVLQNNGGDNLTITRNGSFMFPASLSSGSSYSVTVLTNPASQTCVVSNNAGTIHGADVSSVSVICTTNTYSITPSGDSHESITPNTMQTVSYGSTQSFTVTASSGYTLSNTVGGTCPAGSWSGSTYTTGAITSDCTVSFSATLSSFALTVTKSGNATGAVNSTPAGISCGSTCTASYPSGTMVTLTATPDPGYSFGGWSGGGCSGTGFCTVTVNAITTVTATFINLLEA